MPRWGGVSKPLRLWGELQLIPMTRTQLRFGTKQLIRYCRGHLL